MMPNWPSDPPYLVLVRIEAIGATVRLLLDGALKLCPGSASSSDLIETLRRHKSAIIELQRLRLAKPRRLPKRESLP